MKCEIRTGFLLGGRPDVNEAELLDFLAHPVVVELPVDGDVSRHFAEIVVDLRRAGTPLPTHDVWIAATAAQPGALVLSYDAHFEQIARVGSVTLSRELRADGAGRKVSSPAAAPSHRGARPYPKLTRLSGSRQ